MDSIQTFVEEIDFNELDFHEIVGKGAFGVVSRAMWRGKNVAVKMIATEAERKAFVTERKQLSRVNHPNIVKLHGSCSNPVCLVMEYAEGGSLYNVLHGKSSQPHYTAAHAMSWAIQCARGVDYLHSMKPKALIHRDLKPPNLLLIMGGTVLKICDFGTACDLQSVMTNNKGSAAWMAPEVFEGSIYSETCDVFSWGIILWEVLTRRKPFDEIGGPAFRIMWAVHNGRRPPLIQNLPKPIEILMTKCWSFNAMERPSMSEVVRRMEYLFQFFRGGDQPLVYSIDTENRQESRALDIHVASHLGINRPSSISSPSSPARDSMTRTISDTVRLAWIKPGESRPVTPTIVIEHKPCTMTGTVATVIPAVHGGLDCTRDRYRQGTTVRTDHSRQFCTEAGQQQHEDMSKVICSDGQIYQTAQVVYPQNVEYLQISPPCETTASRPIHHVSTFPGAFSHAFEEQRTNRPLSYPVEGPKAFQFDEGRLSPSDVFEASNVRELPSDVGSSSNPDAALYNRSNSTSEFDLSSIVYQTLDQQLKPLAPCPSNKESMSIFEMHCKLAKEYLQVQTEIALLVQRKHELMREFEQDAEKKQNRHSIKKEYVNLKRENSSLKDFHQNLVRQVAQLRNEQRDSIRRQLTP